MGSMTFAQRQTEWDICICKLKIVKVFTSKKYLSFNLRDGDFVVFTSCKIISKRLFYLTLTFCDTFFNNRGYTPVDYKLPVKCKQRCFLSGAYFWPKKG